MNVTINLPAFEDTIFTQDAFDLMLGTTFPVKLGRDEIPGKLRAAEVSKDGSSVKLTIEIP